MSYYRSESCGHIWTTEKGGRTVVQHITPLTTNEAPFQLAVRFRNQANHYQRCDPRCRRLRKRSLPRATWLSAGDIPRGAPSANEAALWLRDHCHIFRCHLATTAQDDRNKLSPLLECLLTYWVVVGQSNRPITCALYRRIDGVLELRAGFGEQAPLLRQPVLTPFAAKTFAAAWRHAAEVRGFRDLDG